MSKVCCTPAIEGSMSTLKYRARNAEQHQRRPEEREQEELDRGVLAVRSSPDADHEEHREQDDLEEDEEEDQVLCDERSVHPGLEQEQQGQEGLRVVRLRPVVPGVDDAENR